ncbi:hypothetical protein [Tunturiibacter gelidoferens]|uniref:Uncharacterized protein n=1 Tax=Tunturiibacter lichenicola TaxID=2051959 RepID=A0A7Y9NN43_9BACT|nr:hypothetical protein [Edaphobacter lichenicola]NYF52426.1 hypothetical protein [Edaphobacter lichenicola]
MAAAVWTACTKKLFQEKKWSPGESRGLAVFAGVLRGVLGKAAFDGGFLVVKLWCFAWWTWCFGWLFFEAEKCATITQLFCGNLIFS